MGKSEIPKSAITERQLKKIIRAQYKDTSMSDWAKTAGITPQVVSAFMRKIQGAGLQLPEILGYRPQTVYLPIGEDQISTANPPRRPTTRPSSKVDHRRPPIEAKTRKEVSSLKETKKRLKNRNS